ncbi:MAG: hypothetical protein ACRC7O_15500, partial [Fimbriiglobus sp.]
MAFNPFDLFRRNQRILFAILTVFVMFMFVLSFGKGDFFEWLPRWLGSKRGGETVAVVDGAKVTTADLGKVETNRVLANTYMAAAADLAARNLDKYIRDVLPRVSTERRPDVQQVLTARQLQYFSQELRQRDQLAQMMPGRFPPVTIVEAMIDRERTIVTLNNRLTGLLSATAAKEDDLTAARAAADLLRLDLHAGQQSRLYFANQPNGSSRDRFDFLLWKKKADDLGIAFTPTDLNTLLAAEFSNRLTAEDWKQAEITLGNKSGFTLDVLREALADEFRVRAAQRAVLGADVIQPSPLNPSYDAPTDYFKFYQDQTSPARFGFVSVPAENFLPQVSGTPTESELRELFTKYRNVEANPQLPAPGLREPRRLKLGWLEVKG